MSLIRNKEGNFYPIEIQGTDWHCDWKWSTHRGCPHDCVYCSSKKYNIRFGGDPCEIRRLKDEWVDVGGLLEPIRPIRLLPSGTIFVNPYCDIFALPSYDIGMILSHCNDEIKRKNQDAKFIFQTKDPAQYFDYMALIPQGSWLGTTIEYDDNYNYAETSDYIYSKAPSPFKRLTKMTELIWRYKKKYKYSVTVEPIMKFNLFRLSNWMTYIKPDLIFIGANTSKIQLPEPTSEELINLIYSLYEIAGINNVYLKSNIRRLIPAFYDGWKLACDQIQSKGE
jgi:hypothetical protein